MSKLKIKALLLLYIYKKKKTKKTRISKKSHHLDLNYTLLLNTQFYKYINFFEINFHSANR